MNANAGQLLRITRLEPVAATGHRVAASTVGRVISGKHKPWRKTREDLAAPLGVRADQIRWPK